VTVTGSLAAFALVIALGAGCSAPIAASWTEASLRATGRYDFVDGLEVPRVRGVRGCGAQALAAAVAFADGGDARAIADALPWHDAGATPVDLLLAARDRGLEARIARGSWEDLAAGVAAPRAALVMLDAAPKVRTIAGPVGLPVMHWGVVSGVARDGSRVLLGAPEARHHVVPRAEFERRWDASARCLILIERAVEEGSDPNRPLRPQREDMP
jgi:predicted double-glycine peptidase